MAEYITFQPTDYYKTQIYTGTGAENAQTFPQTTAMQPDLTWIKARAGSKSHRLFDSTRGVTKWIASDNAGVQTTTAESLKSFDSDGFTLGTYDHVNDNTVAFVSWNWKAGTTSGIAGSPSITPTSYSFNQTSGFSIIKYTGNYTSGATLPHGLNKKPSMILVKNLSTGVDWAVYSSVLGATKYMNLNTTGAAASATTRWNDTEPTSTLFSVGTTDRVNYDTNNYIAYCFANKKGYSQFGGYTGNGNADGPFVYLGFRPAFLIVKDGTGINNWTMFDDKREVAGNPTAMALQPNTTVAEYDETDGVDFLSNGFKVRESADWINRSGQLTIYVAFASNPFVNSNGVPNNAY